MSGGNMHQCKEPIIPQDATKTLRQSSVPSQSALEKPSGLRMPSPKMGFFDGGTFENGQEVAVKRLSRPSVQDFRRALLFVWGVRVAEVLCVVRVHG
ncbi:hypothetical protein AgCh_038880 [Apium graveolens]